jgi:hypothetical protein
MTALRFRLRQCSLDTPSALKPYLHHVVTESCFSSPFSQDQRSAVESNPVAPATVPALLRVQRPSAVPRRVRAIVVHPFDGMLRTWPPPHVRNKVLKRVPPPLANRDPATPIVGETLVVRIGASVAHRVPDAVFWRVRQPVCQVPRCRCFRHQAAARLRIAARQVAGNHSYLVSTIAAAKP